MFETEAKPGAPDYTQEAAWAALPWRVDAADTVPRGTRFGDRQSRANVDVFYVHPTTDLRKDRWNAPIDDPVTNNWTDRSSIAAQASIFNAAGRIFAPRYRQGSSGSGRPDRADGGPAFALAYGDIERAFDHFLRHWNGERPFILVGHSQGSFMVARLLERITANAPLRNRMVAAFVVGSGLTTGGAAARFPAVPPCETPKQTGCLIAWNSYLDGGDADKYAEIAPRLSAQAYGHTLPSALLCTNPLTFDKRSPSADARRNAGSLYGAPGKTKTDRLLPHAVGAQCLRGVLRVASNAAKKIGVEALAGGSMHYHDYGVFYENVRINAVVRSAAYFARNNQIRQQHTLP